MLGLLGALGKAFGFPFFRLHVAAIVISILHIGALPQNPVRPEPVEGPIHGSTSSPRTGTNLGSTFEAMPPPTEHSTTSADTEA